MEVIFSEYRLPEEIVNSSEQEDVDIIGISFFSAGQGHVVPEVMGLLKEKGLEDVLVIIGGLISQDEIPALKRLGVGEVFGGGSTPHEIIEYIEQHTRIQPPAPDRIDS